MSWLGLADMQSHSLVSLDSARLQDRGTLILETKVAPHARPQTIVGLEQRGATICDLTIQAMPGGGIHFLLRQDNEIIHAALSHDAEDQANLLRISYSWDLPAQRGQLVIERPGTNKLYLREIERPLAIPEPAVAALIQPNGQRHFCEELVFLAISDAVEPIGPMPAICPKTPIQTPYGLKPAGSLKRGDLVTSLTGDTVPVLQVLRKTMPARGSFQPVRLRAPYFGLTQDIVLTPEARLVVGGSQVEYLYGSENVLVPVKHLTSAASAKYEEGHQLVDYVQLLLPDHEPILAGGTAVESLNIGRVRRKKQLLSATLLGDFDLHTLPEHSKTAFPVLKSYEAITLAQLRAA
jgi:hypothetical protein